MVAVELRAFLPRSELIPDGPGATLAKAAGGADIQFESEDFNRAWRVRADDRKFAHGLVNPQVMERLLRDDARGLSLRIEGSDILCWTPGEHGPGRDLGTPAAHVGRRGRHPAVRVAGMRLRPRLWTSAQSRARRASRPVAHAARALRPVVGGVGELQRCPQTHGFGRSRADPGNNEHPLLKPGPSQRATARTDAAGSGLARPRTA